MLHQSIPRTFVGHIYPATVFEPEHDADHLYRPVEHRVFGTSTTRQHLRVDDLLCHLFSSSPLGTLLCKTPYCYMCSRLYITFRCILLLPFTMLHILFPTLQYHRSSFQPFVPTKVSLSSTTAPSLATTTSSPSFYFRFGLASDAVSLPLAINADVTRSNFDPDIVVLSRSYWFFTPSTPNASSDS